MRRHLAFLIAAAAVAPAAASEMQPSWIFKPSTYSHDPATGQRVDQYAAKDPAYVRLDDTYQQSGYRHIRSNLRVGGSADRLHVVQAWGAGEGIRPYGEWQRPFRAGATPYGPWGNSQGPWTMPFDSWINPYGSWNQPYWGQGYQRGGGYPPATPYGSAPGSPHGGPHGAPHGTPPGAPAGPPHGAPHGP